MTYSVQMILDLPMRRHRQTIQGSSQDMAWAHDDDAARQRVEPGDVGNCYTACIASLIGATSIDDVPHIQWQRCVDEHAAGTVLPFHDRRLAREFLRSRGLDLAIVERETAIAAGVSYIVTVLSHKGPWNHAVIASAGQVVFDPSGLCNYTMADAYPEDSTCEVIVLPYDPDPETMVAQWIAAEEMSS